MLEDLLRYGLDVVELFDHVVVDQLFVDVTAGLRLAACDAGPRPGATVAIPGFRAWPVLHFEKERESYNSWLSMLSDTETGHCAISGRVTLSRARQ